MDNQIRYRTAIAVLSLSAAGLIGILNREGYTDHAVIPVPGDVPTIGFGTTTGVKLGDKTNPMQAVGYVFRDIKLYEAAIKQCIHVPLTQPEYDVYLDFSYNVGSGAFCKSTMAKKLNAYDYEVANTNNYIRLLLDNVIADRC